MCMYTEVQYKIFISDKSPKKNCENHWPGEIVGQLPQPNSEC